MAAVQCGGCRFPLQQNVLTPKSPAGRNRLGRGEPSTASDDLHDLQAVPGVELALREL